MSQGNYLAAEKFLSAFTGSAHIMGQMHADDMALVREFAASGSDAVFATLVRRHVNLVYSAALRQLGNESDAEEVSQIVFIILAKKAGSLRGGTILSGWLYQTAQLTAANYQRAAIRRLHREQEAFMQFSEQSEPNASWHRLGPLLEEAMARLGQKERDAIVLRFFENRTVREVAAALGLREDAAQKRVNRATDKLRNYFVRRGIQVSTAALLASIGTHAVQAAPVELASKIAGGAALKGALGGASTLTLKTTLKIMAWTKAKAAITTGVIILLTAGTTTIVVKRIGSPSVDESLWSVNSANLAKAPPVLIIRPTRYPNRVGSVDDGDKVIGLNMPISALFIRAYGPDVSAARMILPPAVARRHYDLMLTLPRHATESLREKLKTQLGLVARPEIVETNVLCLKVKDTARFESSISKGGSPVGYMTSDASFARLIVTNQPVSFLAAQLESLLQIPTIDQTGATGHFDINLIWERNDPRHDSLRNALSNQLGLELVPARMPIKMLVVEKAN